MYSRNPSDSDVETSADYILANSPGFQSGMSVQQKLLLGIRLGFQKKAECDVINRQDPDGPPTEPLNDITAFGEIDLTDITLCLPSVLRQESVISDAETAHQLLGVSPSETTLKMRDSLEINRSQQRKELNAHYKARMKFV